jgi:hypothetical protein
MAALSHISDGGGSVGETAETAVLKIFGLPLKKKMRGSIEFMPMDKGVKDLLNRAARGK